MMNSISKNIKFLILLTLFCISLVSCKSSSPSTSYDKTKNNKPSASELKSNKIIKEARSYTGTKYKFGGTTRAGMDCSGLVFTVFKTAGIDLPRTTSTQINVGRTVKVSEVKEGDLVFFSAKKGTNKVSHVGIVTEVRGKNDVRFIHSSTKAGVIEDNLFAPYYISVFIKATRVL